MRCRAFFPPSAGRKAGVMEGSSPTRLAGGAAGCDTASRCKAAPVGNTGYEPGLTAVAPPRLANLFRAAVVWSIVGEVIGFGSILLVLFWGPGVLAAVLS